MDGEMDLVDFAVDHARSKGATYAEARFERQEPENFILKNGVLDALYVGEDMGIGVRVLVNGALGFAATNSRAKSDIRGIVDDAIKIAKASRRKSKITFAQEDAIEMNWSVPEQRKLERPRRGEDQRDPVRGPGVDGARVQDRRAVLQP